MCFFAALTKVVAVPEAVVLASLPSGQREGPMPTIDWVVQGPLGKGSLNGFGSQRGHQLLRGAGQPGQRGQPGQHGLCPFLSQEVPFWCVVPGFLR